MQDDDPRRRRPAAWLDWAWWLGWAVVYGGFLCHRSLRPAVLGYTWLYAAFLLALLPLFFLPAAVRACHRRFGARSLRRASGVLAALYLVVAARYYATQTHPFDPFLQMPPTSFVARGVPDAKTIRILALGGSTTRGFSLRPGERYPDVMVARLRERYPGVPFEVLNGGMDWYTTRHSLFNYVGYARDFHPDIVVVMHGINDLYRSFSPPDLAIGPYNEQWSHYYGPSINGAMPPSFLRHLLRFPLQRWYSEARLVERDLPLARYVSLPAYERNLRALADYVRADGTALVLVTEPYLYKSGMAVGERAVLVFGRDLSRSRLDWWRQEYPSPESLRRAMAAYNDTTRRVAAATGMTLVDAEARVPKDLAHFSDDVHHTVAGARVLGEAVVEGVILSGRVAKALP